MADFFFRSEMSRVDEDSAFDASQYAFFGSGADAGPSESNLLDGELGGLEDDDDGLRDEEGLEINDGDTFGEIGTSDSEFPSSHPDGGGVLGELSGDLGSLSLKQVIIAVHYWPFASTRTTQS